MHNFLMNSTDISDGLLDKMNRLEINDELMVFSCFDVTDPELSLEQDGLQEFHSGLFLDDKFISFYFSLISRFYIR